uniref:Uncharacterized protein n=1 Tax=Caenorhabditis japonica TaxID=281687 RepID=A0A8R1DSP5_CAEJA
MLAFTTSPSTSSILLSHFDDISTSVCSSKDMFFSYATPSCSLEVTADSDDSLDDSGFFDDSDAIQIGREIGARIATMCDEFDAELMSFANYPAKDRGLLARVLDFFAF